MSVRTKIKAKMRTLDKKANVSIVEASKMIRTKAGVPSTTGVLGELCYDSTNDDVYINTDGSTTWTKIFD